MQIRAGVDLQIAERRGARIDALVVGEFARVGHALVVGDDEIGHVEGGRRQVDGGAGNGRDGKPGDRPRASHGQAPQHAAGEPQDERHDQQVLGRDEVHRAEEQEPAQPRAREIGEIDAAEDPLRLEEHRAQVEGAGQEREHVEQEVAEQPPLLRRVGDEEDGVEGDLLRERGWPPPSAGRTAAARSSPPAASAARTSPCART